MRLFPAVGVAVFAVPAFAHAVFKVVIELFVCLPLDDPGTGDPDLAEAPARILRINRVAVAVCGIRGVRLGCALFADARAPLVWPYFAHCALPGAVSGAAANAEPWPTSSASMSAGAAVLRMFMCIPIS